MNQRRDGAIIASQALAVSKISVKIVDGLPIPDSADFMILTLNRPFLSLTDLPETELPSLTIITGVNGAGKTHLLKALVNGAVKADIAPEIHSDIRSFDWTNLAPKDEIELDASSLRAEQLNIYNQVVQYMQNPYAEPNIFAVAKSLGLKGQKSVDLDVLCNASPDLLESTFGLEAGQGQHVRDSLNAQIDHASINIKNNFGAVQQIQLAQIEAETGKRFISLKSNEFLRASKPIWGETEIFQQSFARLFVSYREIYQNHRLHQMEFQDGRTSSPPLHALDFEEKFGPPPWDFVNSALAAAGLNFTIDAPVIYTRDPYKPRLKKTGSDTEITFEGLSSGERVIMSFAFAVYYASDRRQRISRPKLLLLDEVDAPLHPSMCRSLLATIEEVMVKQHGLAVIMTTHSPSTVALAPEDAVHVMRPGEPGVYKVSRDTALRDLTAGVPTLSLKNDGRRQVFVESPKDVSVYEAAYSATKSLIRSELSPIFVATGANSPSGSHTNTGSDTVRRIVKDLRDAGAEHTIGLLDWDGKNDAGNGICILAEGERNGLESVFFDPLLLLDAVVRHIGISKIPFKWAVGANYFSISEMNAQELQDAIDSVQLAVLKRKRGLSIVVPYTGGFSLSVDQEYLFMDDHLLEGLVMEAFPELKSISRGRSGELMIWIANTILQEHKDHVPECLIDTFKRLVSA